MNSDGDALDWSENRDLIIVHSGGSLGKVPNILATFLSFLNLSSLLNAYHSPLPKKLISFQGHFYLGKLSPLYRDSYL